MNEYEPLLSECLPKRQLHKKPEETVNMPDNYPIISHKDYRYATGFMENEFAYLLPVSNMDGIKINKSGQPCINDILASLGNLRDRIDLTSTKDIDLQLLRELYSFALFYYCKRGIPNYFTVQIYIPDIFAFAGKGFPKKEHIDDLIKKLNRYKMLFGIIEKDIFAVLPLIKRTPTTNTIELCMPYFFRLIELLSGTERKSVGNSPKRTTAYDAHKSPAYSYLIKRTILKEKNHNAVEMVYTIVSTIETAGSHTPHISAKTLIERNIGLKHYLDKASPSDRNKVLKRVFSKAWELLRTQTYLEREYPGIVLPTPTDSSMIPTMSKLQSSVYEFTHNGKKRKE